MLQPSCELLVSETQEWLVALPFLPVTWKQKTCVETQMAACSHLWGRAHLQLLSVPQVEGAARGKVFGQHWYNLCEQEHAEPAQASLNLCRRRSMHQRC